MRKSILWPLRWVAVSILIAMTHPNLGLGEDDAEIRAATAMARAGGGGSHTVSVAGAVHSAGDLISSLDAFNALMDRYDTEILPEEKRKILTRAKDLLAKLLEQANNVESEIMILSQKKLTQAQQAKLDRVLKIVATKREQAKKRMNNSLKAHRNKYFQAA